MFVSQRTSIAAGTLGLTLLGSTSAFAVVNTYFGQDLIDGDPGGKGVQTVASPIANAARSNFLSSLNGVRTENFESFAAGATPPLTLQFGADTATLTSPSGSIQTGLFSGEFATSGTKRFTTTTTTGATSNFTVAFSSPQAAFGFYGTDIADSGSLLTLTFSGGLSKTVSLPPSGITSNPNGNVLFFGLISTTAAETFTSVTFGSSGGTGDVFGFDDLTVGNLTNTPEPASLAVLGLGGVALLRRRRS